ncbi:MAG: sulfur oxidation c-type cytochrome SoxA [Ectothiorhodospiraceae bacterium]|nr:sulfur oxidation c-type cytochrome SoxA [Ectothiorhodospiraceae bacterium]
MSIRSMVKIVTLGIVFITLSACSYNSQDGQSTSQADTGFKAMMALAEAARKKAASMGVEWRDTAKQLKKARIAAKGGDMKKAMKLVTKAKHESEDAIRQSTANESFLAQLSFYDPDASPEQDRKNIQHFFRTKFPGLPNLEFANGVYAMSKVIRENWVAIEEFPPYSPAIEEGDEEWDTIFANNKSYRDCFGGAAIGNRYPRWDAKAEKVETLEMAINTCRTTHGEKPLKYGKSKMLGLTAFIAFQSRGMMTNVVIPDDPKALAAYQSGKKFYFSRRGQLNLACYHCHFENAGKRVRANVLGPMLGQTSHWPAYRSKWGSMGSIHRRYKGCNKQVRAKPFTFQSEEYRNLQFFHTYMSNGIPMNGPGARF